MEEKKAVHRLEGVCLRDEFVCPITHELLRDPVIAGDGYTYEKSAIEKWFLTKDTSPLTRMPVSRNLVPNLTLKKLIQDLINEGATGLYATDCRGRVLDVCAERILNLRCLGPPEDLEWYRQSFQVTPRGCIGGRRPNHLNSPTLSRDIVTFKDTTVSRRHFEIILTAPGQYSIRDLASAGGTFLRVLYGQRKELIQGMIIMLGKHQFVVSSICSLGDSEFHGFSFHRRVEGSEGEGAEGRGAERSSAVASAKNLKDFDESCAGCKDANDSVAGKEEDDESLETCSTPDLSPKRFSRTNPSSKAQSPAGLFFDTRCCVITCCAPEGSPLVGRSFTVGSNGGVLGRSPTCAVPLCRFVDENEKEDPSHAAAVSKLDSAISAEHARIVMDHTTGKVFLLDGTSGKPSTNGTWFRLSGPAQESVPFILAAGDEVLFGTKRFQISESMTVSEEVVAEGLC